MSIAQIMLHKVKIGMILAEDVYKNSQFLIPKGTLVDTEVLSILRYSSVVSVSIYDTDNQFINEHINLPDEQPTHAEQVRNSADSKHFEEVFNNTTDSFTYKLNDIALKNEEIDTEELFQSANELMAGTSNTYHLMDILTNIRYYDDSTYAHSLNVALLANILGQWLHFSEEELKLLTVAGLLHDIGKVKIPTKIIQKPARLTSDEFSVIKQHSLLGYQLLKGNDIDENIAQVALLHHEKCDGSGYPLGLKREQVNPLAKLITIVDVYEAMTANRCYREGICPFSVIKMYEDEGYTKYEPEFLVPFLQGIADTYLHNTVLLNDGRQGEIVLTNKTAISRPSILIDGEYVDLVQHPELHIVTIL